MLLLFVWIDLAFAAATHRESAIQELWIYGIAGLIAVVGFVGAGLWITTSRNRRLAAIADEVSCRACGSLDVHGDDERCAICGFRLGLRSHAQLAGPLSRLQRMRYARDSFDEAIAAMKRSRNLAVADLAGVAGGEGSRDAMEDGQRALMRGWELLDEIVRERPDFLQAEIAELRMGDGLGRDIGNLIGAQGAVTSIGRLRDVLDLAVKEETMRFSRKVAEVA